MPNFIKQLTRPLLKPFTAFFQTEASGGIILLVASGLALVLANSDVGVARYFPTIWERTASFTIGEFSLTKSLSHWINDGLMTLFFLVVGLEIKREIVEGELASFQKALLPLAGAVGGMLLPALFYVLINVGTPTIIGWGIPMATDIAFALAILNLLGNRIPTSIKVFLTALAIADDLGAVLVVAIFYTDTIHMPYLAGALGVWLVLLAINRLHVRWLRIYMLLGLVLWYLMLKSGVHATFAGVLLAMAIPLRVQYTSRELIQHVQARLGLIERETAKQDVPSRDISEEFETIHHQVSSPAQRLEEGLHSWVSYFVIPLFAFCNTSILIDTAIISQLLSPLSVGIAIGLFLGKPVGIMLFVWLLVRVGLAQLPSKVTWRQLVGAAWLAGIGFTMSIFITLLAFDEQVEQQGLAKVAILLASLSSAIVGYTLLGRSATEVSRILSRPEKS